MSITWVILRGGRNNNVQSNRLFYADDKGNTCACRFAFMGKTGWAATLHVSKHYLDDMDAEEQKMVDVCVHLTVNVTTGMNVFLVACMLVSRTLSVEDYDCFRCCEGVVRGFINGQGNAFRYRHKDGVHIDMRDDPKLYVSNSYRLVEREAFYFFFGAFEFSNSLEDSSARKCLYLCSSGLNGGVIEKCVFNSMENFGFIGGKLNCDVAPLSLFDLLSQIFLARGWMVNVPPGNVSTKPVAKL
jgi:hypothetical protein